VGCIERVSDLIDPILGTLLTLVVDSNVDGIEIYNFLESNRDNIRCQFSFGTPISTEPGFQRLILALGIDIECTAKYASLLQKKVCIRTNVCLIKHSISAITNLFVLSKLVLSGSNLLVDPSVADLGDSLKVPDPAIFRLIIRVSSHQRTLFNSRSLGLGWGALRPRVDGGLLFCQLGGRCAGRIPYIRRRLLLLRRRTRSLLKCILLLLHCRRWKTLLRRRGHCP
jgi:hypothetical protein